MKCVTATAGLLFVVLGAGCDPAPYPCVHGIEEGHSYQMTFTAEAPPDYIAPEPSCRGIADIDTLAVGSVVDVQIPIGAVRSGSLVACYFPVGHIASDVGVPLGADDSGTGLVSLMSETLFGVATRTTVQGCELEWSLSAFSKNGRPLDGPDRLWAYRTISFAPGVGVTAACSSAFPQIEPTAFLVVRLETPGSTEVLAVPVEARRGLEKPRHGPPLGAASPDHSILRAPRRRIGPRMHRGHWAATR